MIASGIFEGTVTLRIPIMTVHIPIVIVHNFVVTLHIPIVTLHIPIVILHIRIVTVHIATQHLQNQPILHRSVVLAAPCPICLDSL